MDITYNRSWKADSIDREMRGAGRGYGFDLTNRTGDRPCQICGKVVRMIYKQKFCTACSMIPPYKRRQMIGK